MEIIQIITWNDLLEPGYKDINISGGHLVAKRDNSYTEYIFCN